MAKKIIRHELVEVTVPKGSTLTRFSFPDIPNLRNSLLWGVQVYTVNTTPKSIISGNAVLSHTNVLHNSFITLQNYSGKEFLKQAPAAMFNTLHFDASNSTNMEETDIKAFVGQKVSWPKSYIEFTTAPADALADTVYLISVYYSYSPSVENQENTYTFLNQK